MTATDLVWLGLLQRSVTRDFDELALATSLAGEAFQQRVAAGPPDRWPRRRIIITTR